MTCSLSLSPICPLACVAASIGDLMVACNSCVMSLISTSLIFGECVIVSLEDEDDGHGDREDEVGSE